MNQDMAKRIAKTVTRRTTKMKLSRSQMFLLSHNRFEIPIMNSNQPAYIDRYSMFISREKHAGRTVYATWALNWCATVAQGLAPDPVGWVELPLATGDLIGLGANRPSAVLGNMRSAWQDGLKSLRPAKEGTDDQFGVNNRYMHAHMAAKNVGIWTIIESDGNVVRFWATDDLNQFVIWKENLRDKDFLKSRSREFKLGFRDGYQTITIDGATVYLRDIQEG